MFEFQQREERFCGEEGKNGVMSVVIIQMSPVGDLQDWKVLWEKPVGLT